MNGAAPYRERIDALVQELDPIIRKHFPEHGMITDTSHLEVHTKTGLPFLAIWMTVHLEEWRQ